MTTFKKPYGKHTRSDFNTIGDSATKQQFKAECDINTILKKYQRTGLLEHTSKFKGNYADLSEPTDYQTALNIVLQANDAFSSLPSNIRKQFGNNPAAFLDFVDNPDNADALIEMGLRNPSVKEEQVIPDSTVTETTENPPAG